MTSKIKSPDQVQRSHRNKVKALKAIQSKNPSGLLTARDVVDEAAHPDHPLHGDFIWDDTVAADKFRLQQARQLIRSFVVDTPQGGKMPAFISLMPDRSAEEGGYRSTEEVITSAELLAQWRATAEKELLAWMERNKAVTELVEAVSAATGIKAPPKRKPK